MDLRPYLGSSEKKIWQTIKPQGPNLPAEELQARMFSELLLGETKNFSLILAFWSILRAAAARSKYSPPYSNSYSSLFPFSPGTISKE